MKNRLLPLIFSLLYLSNLADLIHLAQAEDIKIGLLVGSNSILSEEAAQIKNGLDLAVTAINTNSSKRFKISVVSKDTQLNPELAKENFNEITQGSEKVKFIIGPQTTNEVLQVAPFAKNNRVVMITPSARSDEISMMNDFVFRTRHSQLQESKFFAQFIKMQIKNRPLNTLIVDSFAGTSMIKIFKSEFNRIGGNFGLFEDLYIDRPDYQPFLYRLKNLSATYVYVLGFGVQVADLVLEAAQAGLKLRFFGTSDHNNPILLERAGSLAEGFSFPYSYDPDNNPKSASFAKDYQIRFGKEANFIAANSYDAAMILSQCLEKVGDNADAVKSCLYYIRNYEGAGGRLSIDRNGNCSRDLFVKVIRGGKFIRLPN